MPNNRKLQLITVVPCLRLVERSRSVRGGVGGRLIWYHASVFSSIADASSALEGALAFAAAVIVAFTNTFTPGTPAHEDLKILSN